jgi:hypothetical protein
MLRMEQREAHKEAVNCGPRSDVRPAGTPKRLIQPLNNACAQAAAVVEANGIASGQLEYLSTTVSKCVKPPEGGSGPTISTLMLKKQWLGTGIAAAGGYAWQWVFALWQNRHSRAHCVTVAAILGHTKRLVILLTYFYFTYLLTARNLVALRPGCAAPCRASNTAR